MQLRRPWGDTIVYRTDTWAILFRIRDPSTVIFGPRGAFQGLVRQTTRTERQDTSVITNHVTWAAVPGSVVGLLETVGIPEAEVQRLIPGQQLFRRVQSWD